MKYLVSELPNTGKALNFKVRCAESDKVSTFSISRKLIDVWGNPLKIHLKDLMVAYIKCHGWGKAPVEMTPANSPRSLGEYIASLPAAKAKAKA